MGTDGILNDAFARIQKLTELRLEGKEIDRSHPLLAQLLIDFNDALANLKRFRTMADLFIDKKYADILSKKYVGKANSYLAQFHFTRIPGFISRAFLSSWFEPRELIESDLVRASEKINYSLTRVKQARMEILHLLWKSFLSLCNQEELRFDKERIRP